MKFIKSGMYEYADYMIWKNEQGRHYRERGPCVIVVTGSVKFSQISEVGCNRKRGPAEIYPDGTIVFQTTYSARHRTTGPAIIRSNGSREYWVFEQLVSPDEFFLKYGVL